MDLGNRTITVHTAIDTSSLTIKTKNKKFDMTHYKTTSVSQFRDSTLPRMHLKADYLKAAFSTRCQPIYYGRHTHAYTHTYTMGIFRNIHLA